MKWACKRGRAAIFADTGLGKSRMQLAWADAVHKHTKRPVLILAPLAVAPQTVAEGAEIGVMVQHCRDGAEVTGGIIITNYDRLHRFDPGSFGAVVLDESSCIKHHDAKTLRTLLTAFRDTPYKLCATATPAPNDWTELGTHAEFLGICTRAEMLAEYFTHDGGDTSVWRLKGHARHIFWQWVSQWGAMVRKPSDLGFDDSAYTLPPLHLHEHTVATEMPTNGMLFAFEAQTLSERRDARRMSLQDRVNGCAAIVYGEWSKLAAQQECAYGMEARICRIETEEGAGRSRVPGQTECAGIQGQSSASGVHERVRQGEPGEVQADARAAGRLQRSAPGAVCGVGADATSSKGCGEGLAGAEPAKAQRPTAEAVRDRGVRLQRPDDGAESGVCDLRAQGNGQAEFLSGGGSLPQDWQSSRPAVHVVQHGIGQVQGQHGFTVFGNRLPDEAWLIWCDLNDEQDALERAFGGLAFSVRGSDTAEEKEQSIRRWLARERPVMISKPSIMGFGLNFQHCRRMAFVGVTDSFEAYYQAVRRCWRFGQKRHVHVHVFASSSEGAVVANLKRKERDATLMAESLSQETRDAVMQEVTGTKRMTNTHKATNKVNVPLFLKATS